MGEIYEVIEHAISFTAPTKRYAAAGKAVPERLKRPLIVDTGADSIQWSYEMITTSIPTKGGEVIQVLGMSVGPLTVSGTCRNSMEAQRLAYWFRDYMTISGTGERDENALTFTYPTRGWTFQGHIVAASGFAFGTTLQHAIPWSVTIEVQSEEGMDREVGDPSPLETVTEGLVLGDKALFDKTISDMEFTLAPKISGGDAALTGESRTESEEEFRNVGDNFQRLIASWTSGDFSLKSFDPLADPDTQFTLKADEIWEKIYGRSTVIAGGDGQTQSQYDFTANPTGKLEIVNAIVAAFEAKDAPGRLGVAVALLESNLDPTAFNGNYLGLFQTAPASEDGKTVSKAHTEPLDNAYAAARAQSGTHSGARKASKIVEHYPASMQIEDAATWFNVSSVRPSGASKTRPQGDSALTDWAMAAQGVNLSNNPLFARIPEFLRKADELIKEAKASAAAGTVDGDFAKPMASGSLSSPIYRNGADRDHYGVDISAPIGTPIYAAQSGTIKYAGTASGFGQWIVLESANYSFVYGHIEGIDVQVGQSVAIGAKIGTSGNRGVSSGPHLHFEMRKGKYVGGATGVMDPWPVFGKFFK